MVVNKIVVCPICGKKTYLRIQVGNYLSTYPIRVNCMNCRALLKGTFIMEGNSKKRGLIMLNAEIEECDFNITNGQNTDLDSFVIRNADYVAEVSGELPCSLVGSYSGGIPLSPFMQAIDRIDSIENRIVRLQHFDRNMSEWNRAKSIAFQLLDEGSIDYISIALHNRMGEYQYECDHYLKSLHCLQEVVLDETKYLFVPSDQDNCIQELIHLLSSVDKEMLHSFCNEMGGTTALLLLYRKAINVFSDFMKIYPHVLPAETYLYFKDKKTINQGVSTCSFADIKTFYQDAYESLLSLLVVPLCLDNITIRKDFQLFDKTYEKIWCKGNRNLAWYLTLDNGKRINKINTDEAFQRIIALPANRLLRNGIGHNNISYDGITQIIKAYDYKKVNKVRIERSLMDMAIDCIGMAKSAVIMSEMILYLLREEFRKVGIKTIIHPRYYKEVGPNEKCPCGSGKKYKKCCKNEIDAVRLANERN